MSLRLLAWLCLLAVPLAAQPTGSRIVESARLDPRQGINFDSGLWPERVYVGQQATYEIGIFLSDEMRTRLRRNPQFVPPDVRSMIAYDLPVPSGQFARTAGGRHYDVHVFARALFPLTAGVHEIGAARLEYAVPLSSSIFAREESHTARSRAHRLVSIEPPMGGRPADYHGAVGRLGVRARLDTAAPRVGDPLLVTLMVSGVGNVSLFPRPDLRIPWGQAVPGPERVRIDSAVALVSGIKEFDWVVTPRRAGRQEVPAVRYPYFNPYTEQYEVALTQPLGIEVRPGGLATPVAEAVADGDRLSIRRTWRGAVPRPVAASPVFWATVLLAPLPALLVRARRRDARPSRRPPPRDVLRRLSQSPGASARDIRRQAHAALAERVPQARPTFGGDGRRLERALRRAGVSRETAHAARSLFSRLDEAAYAPASAPEPDLAARALSLLAAVDDEARALATPPRRRFRLWGLILLTASTGAVAAGAATEAREAAMFAAGVVAWDSGRVEEAREQFRALAETAPRAADAWANLGTTSWTLGDTAASVVGWQRALRLEPMASDVRDRLRATPSFRDGMLGDIPAIPVNLLSLVAGLLWIVGWLVLARERRPAGPASPGLRTLLAAGLAGLIALAAAERLSGRRQVVLLATERLRTAPAVGAETGVGFVAGETAQLVATRGIWERIRFNDNRDGWVERRVLESLDLPPAR